MNKMFCTTLAAVLFASAACDTLAQTDAGGINPSEAPVPDDVESLGKQLGAQKAINQQLRQRLESLERQLGAMAKADAPLIVGLDANAPAPAYIPQSDVENTAIEETLGTKGVTLLPVGMYRVTPTITWSHNGSGSSRIDAYALGLGVETGLPYAMAIAAVVPYVWRDDAVYGSNHGLGDFAMSLSKKLTNETDTMPSWVAKLGYKSDNGKDPFTTRSIGSGYQTYDLSLSAVKRFEPVALYGNFSYAHSFEKSAAILAPDGTQLFNGQIQPGDVYSLGLGVSLAATPTISLDAGLSFALADKSYFRPNTGDGYTSNRATAGYMNVGTGFQLSKHLLLSLSASAGVTADATSFIFSLALPYRF